ncbi:hypothetical protein HWV62_10192 [Athelia sp. TMB]|nr:hypothetical protein HWV62_10192 [Athelia sp. TMB]
MLDRLQPADRTSCRSTHSASPLAPLSQATSAALYPPTSPTDHHTPILHARIWARYLLHAEVRGGLALVSAYRHYLSVGASLTEHYTILLLNPTDEKEKRLLEAAKLLLGLARGAARGEYVSAEGESTYGLPATQPI